MGLSTTVTLATDSDGFVSQECPVCARRFKVVFGEGSEQPISHCPYCGHSGQNCWWTQDQADYLTGVAGEEFVDPLLDDFARRINRSNRPGGLVRFSAKVTHGPRPSQPTESDAPMPILTFRCCGERVKHDGSAATLHCVICGASTNVE